MSEFDKKVATEQFEYTKKVANYRHNLDKYTEKIIDNLDLKLIKKLILKEIRAGKYMLDMYLWWHYECKETMWTKFFKRQVLWNFSEDNFKKELQLSFKRLNILERLRDILEFSGLFKMTVSYITCKSILPLFTVNLHWK